MDAYEYFLICETERDGHPTVTDVFGPMDLADFHATYERVTSDHDEAERPATLVMYAARLVYHERREPGRPPEINPRRKASDHKPRPQKAV